jgi:hypothetical protein
MTQKQKTQSTNETFNKHEVLTKTAYKLERKLRRLYKEIEREIDTDWVFRLPNINCPLWSY